MPDLDKPRRPLKPQIVMPKQTPRPTEAEEVLVELETSADQAPQTAPHAPDEDDERLREQIIQNILADGGMRLMTSLAGGVSQKYSLGGFQEISLRLKDYRDICYTLGLAEASMLTPEEQRKSLRLREVLAQHEIYELVDIRHDIRPVRKAIPVPGRKGILGIGKTPDSVRYEETGQTAATPHNVIVENGKPEPAVRLTYFVKATWRDYSGRTGQEMVVELVLPESTAQEIEQQLANDPAFIRQIAERVIKAKMLKDPSAWETPQGQGDPVGPLYKEWDARPNGGRIYIQKEGTAPGWHEEFVHKVQHPGQPQ